MHSTMLPLASNADLLLVAYRTVVVPHMHINDPFARPRESDHFIFHRLAHHFEDARAEFREFVQQQA
jgi:hypothetical protein